MKKAKLHTDPRFGKSPAVRQSKDGEIIIAANILTASRLFIVNRLLFKPFEFLWQLIVSLCILELVFLLMKQYDVFRFLPCSRMQLYLILFGLFQFWFWEKVKGYMLTRFLFGRRFIITITPEKLQFGGRVFKKTFSRDQRVMFSSEKFFKAEDPIYQASSRLCLIVGDAHRTEIMEVFGSLTITKLINNANTALRLTDPDKRRPAIARSCREKV